ncbi:hypothetical protein IAU59_007398 [Kwoniella sp. CBS 9459]
MSMLSSSILIRRTPTALRSNLHIPQASRALSTSLASHAASAPNPYTSSTVTGTTSSPTATATGNGSRYVRKTAVPSRSAGNGGYSGSSYSKSPSSSSTYSTNTPRSTTSTTAAYRKPAAAAASPSRPRSAAPAPAPAVSAQDALDDYVPDDFPLPPSQPQIDDYAHLAPSPPSSSSSSYAAPTASPPLTSLPGEGYQPLPTVQGSASASAQGQGIQGEAPVLPSSSANGAAAPEDWSTSFAGLSERPFDRETADALLKPLSPQDVEIKPDGLLYLPEIKYRRTLNAAFGPGGWGLAPRGETHVGPRIVSREWGLVCLGRLVSVARGEQEYFDPSGVPTATEACKSNALMRCCKDLGIASELWDPTFIRDFKKSHCIEVFTEHAMTKKKKKLWRKRDSPKFDYPWKEGV